MARKYGSVDAARRGTATRKSSRKPGGGRTKKKVQRGAAKAAPGYASERYGPGATKRKGTRKPGGNAAAAKKRKTKAMTKAAGKSAPSYIKTKPNVKKPGEHKGRKPKASKGASKPGEHKARKPKRVAKKPNEHKSKKPKPRIEHQGRKPRKSRNVAHGSGSGIDAMSISDKFYEGALGAALDRGIKKAAAQKVKQKTKGRSTYKKGGGIR